jgi:hypothetical protein
LQLSVGEFRNNNGQREFPYLATFDIALDLSDTKVGTEEQGGMGRAGAPPRS